MFGIWLRKMKGIPLLCVNTTHLPAAYEVLLPEKLQKNELVQTGLLFTFKRPFERLFSGIYNQSDGLIVLGESKEDCLRLFEAPVYKVLALQLPAAVFEEAGVAPPLGPGSYGLDDFIPSRWGREDQRHTA